VAGVGRPYRLYPKASVQLPVAVGTIAIFRSIYSPIRAMPALLYETPQCLNCRGVEGIEPPTVFTTPPLTHCQIMYRRVSYILYTYDLYHNFVWSPTVEKFNPSQGNLSRTLERYNQR